MYPEIGPEDGRNGRSSRPLSTRRAISLGAACAMAAGALLTLAPMPASADPVPAAAPGPHPKTITACDFVQSVLIAPTDGLAMYAISFTPQDAGYLPGDWVYTWQEWSLNGEVQYGGAYTDLLRTTGEFYWGEDLDGQVWTWRIGAVDDSFVDNGNANNADWNTGAAYGGWLCSLTLTYGSTSSPVPAAPMVALACAQSSASVGATVTCSVTGGEPGIDILWRASYNPVFAAAGVTLDADGNGTFSFVIPAAARGQEVMVELVEWTAPMSLGVTVGGPVPTTVPAGQGRGAPAGPLAVAVGLALVAGMVVRRRAVDLVG
jgi:hypothetical protein